MKCTICDEKIKKVYSTKKGKPACEDCYNNAWEYCAKIFEFYPDGTINKILFDDDFGSQEGESPVAITGTKWVKTDGWRGSTDFILAPGFIEYAEGWITGYPDETTTHKKELGEYFDQLQSGEIKPPVLLTWVFAPTSNVFSTASSIIIKKEDQKKVDEWVAEINGGPEEFKQKFN